MDTASNKNKWFVDALFGLTFFVGCVGVKYAAEALPTAKAEEQAPVNRVCDCLRCEENSSKLAIQAAEIVKIKLAVADLIQHKNQEPVESNDISEPAPPKPKEDKKLDKKIIYFEQSPRCQSGRCR